MGVTQVHIFGAEHRWEPFKQDKSTSCDFIAFSATLQLENLTTNFDLHFLGFY